MATYGIKVIKMNTKETNKKETIYRLKERIYSKIEDLESYGLKLIKENNHEIGEYILSNAGSIKFNIHELMNVLELNEKASKEYSDKKIALLKDILSIMERDEKK